MEKKKAVELEAEDRKPTDEPQKSGIKFIENPLPLPKKHVKRTMDYRFEPEPELMKYDIQVKENDDFDLK